MSIIYIDNVTETHYHIKTMGHIKNIRGKTIKFIEHPFQTLHKIPKSEFIKNKKAVTIIDDRILNIFDKYNKFQIKSFQTHKMVVAKKKNYAFLGKKNMFTIYLK